VIIYCLGVENQRRIINLTTTKDSFAKTSPFNLYK